MVSDCIDFFESLDNVWHHQVTQFLDLEATVNDEESENEGDESELGMSLSQSFKYPSPNI